MLSKLACVTAIVLLIWLASAAKSGSPTWPVADRALIEIDTIHAAHGDQLLGAYSQYGWYHPGPFLFYVLAPFYVAAGRTEYGLHLGALAINLGSWVLIVLILRRRHRLAATTGLLLLGTLFLYFCRVPDLLTSPWNPHVSVWPFAALLVCAAGAISGDLHLVPVVVVLASFVTQTHVGFTPVAVALSVLSLGPLIGWSLAEKVEHSIRGSRAAERLALALFVAVIVQIVWLPPLAEQLTGHPGNLTKLWRFFTQTAETQPLSAAVNAWSSMLSGVIRPGLITPRGWGLNESSILAMPVALMTSILGLPLVIIVRWKNGHRFEVALAGVCLVASVIGIWSVRHIRGPIMDNQVFWLSALGAFNIALTLSLVVGIAERRMRSKWWRVDVRRPVAIAIVISAVALGVIRLRAEMRPAELSFESENVRRLTVQMSESLPSMGARKPLLRIAGRNWAMGFGLALQLYRSSIIPAMDASVATEFDLNLAATGREDVLVMLSDRDVHDQVVKRPGNVTLAATELPFRLYVDAVSLIDHPEYR